VLHENFWEIEGSRAACWVGYDNVEAQLFSEQKLRGSSVHADQSLFDVFSLTYMALSSGTSFNRQVSAINP